MYYTVYQKEKYTILDVKRRNILFCILKRRNILYCILKGETYYTAYQKEKSIIPHIKTRNILHCISNGEKYSTVYQKKKHTFLYIKRRNIYLRTRVSEYKNYNNDNCADNRLTIKCHRHALR